MIVFFRCTVLFLSIILGMPATFFALPVEQKSGFGCPDLDQAQAKYLALNQYNEFVDFLNNYKDKDKVSQPCLDYYKANTRYLQLKYLEEQQSWDDYFANGNSYRDQLVENAQKVINQADANSYLRVKSRQLIWQFHRDQLDAFAQTALDDLVAEVTAYSKTAESGGLNLIKEVADKLLVYEEKTKAREIYKLYVEGLLAQKMSPAQLKTVAAGFYKQGNLDLAQSIYDIYIEQISATLSPEQFISELFEVASLFVYKPAGLYEMAYAEKIYAKIESLGAKDVFNEDAIYLRALNSEKMFAYPEAQKYYLALTSSYPDTKYFDEATYKAAMINAYALANIEEAKKYFESLSAKTGFTPLEVRAVTAGDLLLTGFSPQVISAFYQLGLLSQWEGNLVKAKDYYDLLLKNAQDKYPLAAAKAKERLKEIQENIPLSYNLKTFMDLSLKKEPALPELNKSQLKSSAFVLDKNQNNTVSLLVNMPQSGCNQVDLQYLWSGDLGGANPLVTESSFSGAYSDSGTKEINVVLISPAGTIDRSFMMLDVY